MEPSYSCEMCDVSGTSLRVLLEHFESKKHKKKLARRQEINDMCSDRNLELRQTSEASEQRVPSPDFRCKLCYATVHNMKDLMQHNQGSKHKAKFAKAATDIVDAQEADAKPKKPKISQVKLILDAVVFSDGKDLANERRKLVIDLIENRCKNCLLERNSSSLSECGFCDRNFSTARDCHLHRMSDHPLKFAAVKLLMENPEVITDPRILQ